MQIRQRESLYDLKNSKVFYITVIFFACFLFCLFTTIACLSLSTDIYNRDEYARKIFVLSLFVEKRGPENAFSRLACAMTTRE